MMPRLNLQAPRFSNLGLLEGIEFARRQEAAEVALLQARERIETENLNQVGLALDNRFATQTFNDRVLGESLKTEQQIATLNGVNLENAFNTVNFGNRVAGAEAKTKATVLNNEGAAIRNRFLEPSLKLGLDSQFLNNTSAFINNQTLGARNQSTLDTQAVSRQASRASIQASRATTSRANFNLGLDQQFGVQDRQSIINQRNRANTPRPVDTREATEARISALTTEIAALESAAPTIENSQLLRAAKAQLLVDQKIFDSIVPRRGTAEDTSFGFGITPRPSVTSGAGSTVPAGLTIR